MDYLFRPDALNWQNGLLYGTGHGGAECILIGANSLILGLFLLLFPGILPLDVTIQIQNMALYMPFVALLERIFALCIQIGLSIVVLQSFIHTAVDFFAVLANQKSFILAEAVTGIFAVFGLYLIWKFKKSF